MTVTRASFPPWVPWVDIEKAKPDTRRPVIYLFANGMAVAGFNRVEIAPFVCFEGGYVQAEKKAFARLVQLTMEQAIAAPTFTENAVAWVYAEDALT